MQVPSYRAFHHTLKPKQEDFIQPDPRPTCRCRHKVKGNKHLSGCPYYQQQEEQSLKTPEDSGLNTNDNMSINGGDSANDESIGGNKRKGKRVQKIDENKRKKKPKVAPVSQVNEMQKHHESSIATGVSVDQESTHAH
jgi:hypothetical protein